MEVEFFHAINPSLREYELIRKKINDLTRVLATYQGKAKVHFVDYKAINSAIVAKAPPKLRMILFKRSLFRLGSKLAKKR